MKYYSVETGEGKKIYEIGFEQKERKYDVTYAANGKLSGAKETIQPEALPEKVQAGRGRVFPKYELEIIEKVAKGGKAFFDVKAFVEVSGKKVRYELLFSADGNLLEKEKRTKMRANDYGGCEIASTRRRRVQRRLSVEGE